MSAPPSVSSLAKDNGGTFPMEVELRARFRLLEKVIGELLLRRRTLYPTELWMQGTVLPLVFSAIARFSNQTHADRRRQNRYKTRASQSFDRLPSKSLFDFPDELRNQMTFHPADFFLPSSPKYYRGTRMKSQFI